MRASIQPMAYNVISSSCQPPSLNYSIVEVSSCRADCRRVEQNRKSPITNLTNNSLKTTSTWLPSPTDTKPYIVFKLENFFLGKLVLLLES